MVLFLRDDLVLETFDSTDLPPIHIEWTDVENGEFEFCSDTGQRYAGRLHQRGGVFKGERWDLIPEGKPDVQNALAIVERAIGVDSRRCAFPDLESLKRHLTSRRV